MTNPKAILIAAAMISAAIIAHLYLGDRYVLAPGFGGSVWKVDKLTGATWHCYTGECRPISQ